MIVPLVVMLMLGLAGGWRIGWARAQLAEAAAAGARAATLAGSAPQAVQQATAAIEFDLATVDVHCSSLSVQIDASERGEPQDDDGRADAARARRRVGRDKAAAGPPSSARR